MQQSPPPPPPDEGDVNEKLAALRYKAIVERVLTAPYRGTVIMEVSVKAYEENCARLGYTVEWGVPDIFGFMRPTTHPIAVPAQDPPLDDTPEEPATLSTDEGV